jgi:endonuclease YncB( thermonuclease family)
MAGAASALTGKAIAGFVVRSYFSGSAPGPPARRSRQGELVMRALIAAALIAVAAPAVAAEAIVTDGGTLILDGALYRLDGIDAPQTDQTCLDAKGAAWTCGIAARDALREHVGKRAVRCTDRGRDSNAGSRRIGECFAGDEMLSLNQWMVRQGWALDFGQAAKSRRYGVDRSSAIASGAGLWKGCFVAPDDLRRITISTARLLGAACPKTNNMKVRETLFPEYPAMPAGCDVKGRIVLRSQVGGFRGIYHVPACRSYPRTKTVNRWFCSEDEARAAGFRKSYTC